MITVATCSNPAEAMLLKSLLEANDIPAFVPDELTAQTAPNYSGSGLRLQVADEHADSARRILQETENAPIEDISDPEHPADAGESDKDKSR